MSTKVIVITGPTSSGKSSLAYHLACQHAAVILCADAMTLYRGLNVGTAKPSLTERSRILHYGVDIRELNEEYSVSDFRDLALKVVAKHEKVIIVGGTQYYISALLKPHAQLPRADWELRRQIEQNNDVHTWLKKCDPTAARRLHPNDRVRIVRAIEVFLLTGQTMSSLLQQTPTQPLIDAEIFYLDRERLRDRIRSRIAQMVEKGYLDEVERICSSGIVGTEKPLKSFSYAPLIQYFEGTIALSEALWLVEKGTWHLARKQRTWGRKMGWSVSTADQIMTQASEILK